MQQTFTLIPISELEENIKRWMKEVLAEQQSLKSDIVPDLLSRNQTAALLKVTLTTLHNWHMQGKLIPKKIGRRILYDKQQIISELKSADRLKYKRGKNETI
jgi:hypothetical protein